MGQKSRAKRQSAPKKVSATVQATVVEGQTLQRSSLVKSSATFQPKTVQFEEALSVRRIDIKKIGLLGAVMLFLLAALTVFSATSPLLSHLGSKLTHAARL